MSETCDGGPHVRRDAFQEYKETVAAKFDAVKIQFEGVEKNVKNALEAKKDNTALIVSVVGIILTIVLFWKGH